ncbi:MAG: histone H1-like repetitive region-containing protein [Alphaproteobacteria bacterium]|nr:histone H1-like repetitive region-containing protein [Alphaproteobacteria bacterium]
MAKSPKAAKKAAKKASAKKAAAKKAAVKKAVAKKAAVKKATAKKAPSKKAAVKKAAVKKAAVKKAPAKKGAAKKVAKKASAKKAPSKKAAVKKATAKKAAVKKAPAKKAAKKAVLKKAPAKKGAVKKASAKKGAAKKGRAKKAGAKSVIPAGRPGVPNPIDIFVGEKMRMRRITMGLSQQRLAALLGLTFQQIQKYERGANRLSASRLWDLHDVLEVPIDYFYEGMSDAIADNSPRLRAGVEDTVVPDVDIEPDPMAKRETLELARYYHSIKDPKVRRAVFDLVRSQSLD